MSTGKLIVKKEDFELLLKSQIESGYNLLNREIRSVYKELHADRETGC